MNKFMKKGIALAVSVVTVLGLVGCGSGASTDSSSSGTSNSTTGTNSNALEVMIWDTNQQAGIQKICDLFTEETGIPVEVQVSDWDSYWTLLEAGASGGALPDVFWMHSNNSQMYMKNDMLLKLDDYIASSDKIDITNYMEEITELYTWEGSYYAIPKDYDTIALWYNKTMFDDAGLSYPDATWTWDDMYNAAVALTKEDGSQYGFALNPSNDQDTYYNMVYSMGGYIVSDDKKTSGYDDENTLRAMNYIGSLLENATPNATTMSETGTDVMFSSGTVAMITQGSWMLAGFMDNEYLVENADIAILPYDAVTGNRASLCNGLGWSASASTDRADDCWKLLEWLGSEKMQLMQAELGITMSAYKGTSEAWANSTDVFNLQGYFDVTEESTGDAKNLLVLRPYTYNSTVWSTAAQERLVSAWNTPSTMTDVCVAFAEEMNGYIAAENN